MPIRSPLLFFKPSWLSQTRSFYDKSNGYNTEFSKPPFELPLSAWQDLQLLTWFKGYVNNAQLLNQYTEATLLYIARATFCLIQHDKTNEIANMTTSQIHHFDPMNNPHNETTTSRLMTCVSQKLKDEIPPKNLNDSMKQAVKFIAYHYANVPPKISIKNAQSN